MLNGEDWTQETYLLAERAIGYQFTQKELLKQCFTHKSYSNAFGGENNERLEFLGDAVLQLIVSDALYRRAPVSEGKLTEKRKEYVSKQPLEVACQRAGILRFLRYSGGENNIHGKTESNLFEAVTAGIYLDGGMNAARDFVKRFLLPQERADYKNKLQERVQEKDKSLPEYRVAEKDGAFVCEVFALGYRASGTGTSRKAAQQSAAKSLLEILEKGTSH